MTSTYIMRVEDRKSTRLNSSHPSISYAVFCLQKKTPADLANWHNEEITYLNSNTSYASTAIEIGTLLIPVFFRQTALFNALFSVFFFFNDTATTEIYTLSLHDALPISRPAIPAFTNSPCRAGRWSATRDRRSTRLNSSHPSISYAVFCLKKKKKQK